MTKRENGRVPTLDLRPFRGNPDEFKVEGVGPVSSGVKPTQHFRARAAAEFGASGCWSLLPPSSDDLL